MKQIVVVTVFAMVFGLAAMAQTAPRTPQPAPQGTSPAAQPQTSPSHAPDASIAANQNPVGETKGERKLKGCVESESGKYMLADEQGKKVSLSGAQDFAAHVGHIVTASGTFAKAADASNGASTAPNSEVSASDDQFIVSKLDMVSETCKVDKTKK